MEFSIVGATICCGILLVALPSNAPLIVALIMSFAFGSTAIVSFSSLGGSSPIIYVIFAAALIASVALRRDVIRDLGTVFSQQPAAWLLVVLALYTVAGSYLLPRLFAGETTAFIPRRPFNDVVEVPLGPATGNITQSLYFVLGILSFLAVCVLLLQPRRFLAIRQGYFAWATLHVAMGFIDLFGKVGGLGDVLAPIRTASYAMFSDVGIEGFWRIAGAYSEASAFGAVTVVLLAFCFTYWRYMHDVYALALSVALLILLVLSTSSTAYVGGAIILTYLLASLTRAAIRNRLRKQDLLLLVAAIASLAVVIGVVLYNENALDPFWRLFDTMILEKASSASGHERAYWNYRSLQSIYETVGFGVGLGSSRASSWFIAVASQLGVAGALIFGYLILQLIRCGPSRSLWEIDRGLCATALSVRSAYLAGILTAAVSSGNADPGVSFFVGVAVVLSYGHLARQSANDEARIPRFSHSRIGQRVAEA